MKLASTSRASQGKHRNRLYLRGKQAHKGKQVAIAGERWHDIDDTPGHRMLAALRKMGKKRARRVMKQEGGGQTQAQAGITFGHLSH
ncbi:hypothetical protein KTAU_30820 [Thermogemmatispora aurantia]|nr:hypothetical protein KTAU_30820 [Thermogemmatispora aurantia]